MCACAHSWLMAGDKDPSAMCTLMEYMFLIPPRQLSVPVLVPGIVWVIHCQVLTWRACCLLTRVSPAGQLDQRTRWSLIHAPLSIESWEKETNRLFSNKDWHKLALDWLQKNSFQSLRVFCINFVTCFINLSTVIIVPIFYLFF